MAAAQILATASGAADSSDVTVAAGTPLTVSLKGTVIGQMARVIVFLKDDNGNYVNVGMIDSDNPVFQLSAPGVYRFSRTQGTCGVFSA